jgi:hypothetical protein
LFLHTEVCACSKVDTFSGQVQPRPTKEGVATCTCPESGQNAV